MYDIVVCGSAVVDMFVKTHCDTISMNDKWDIGYRIGSKILINEKRVMIGGGGTNTSTAFARLKLNTAYLGCLGDDADGRMILDFLKEEKVDFIGYITKKNQTGYSVILDSQNEDRTLLTFKGANNDLDFKKVLIPATKWIYSSSLIEKSFRTLKKIAALAKKRKINFAFNPSNYQAKQGAGKLKRVLSCTNLLVLNREEARKLIKSDKETPELAKSIHKLLADNATITITDGKKGVILYNGKDTFKVLPPKCKIVETTGAGDAFASTFLAYKIKGKSDKTALKAAMENSKSVITHYGAKNILLTKGRIDRKLKTSRIKVKKLN